MSEQQNPIVGIDLGTTYSAIALYEADHTRFFANPLGQELTPSVVAWDRRNQGIVEIKGSPKRPAGTDFSVRFTFAFKGILDVEASMAGVERW